MTIDYDTIQTAMHYLAKPKPSQSEPIASCIVRALCLWCMRLCSANP